MFLLMFLCLSSSCVCSSLCISTFDPAKFLCQNCTKNCVDRAGSRFLLLSQFGEGRNFKTHPMFINELIGSGSLFLDPLVTPTPNGTQAKLEETGIFLVMSFELLGGSQKIRGGGQLRRRLEKKKKILLKAFKDAGPVFGDGKGCPRSPKK